jgi:hypothetical protein
MQGATVKLDTVVLETPTILPLFDPLTNAIAQKHFHFIL